MLEYIHKTCGTDNDESVSEYSFGLHCLGFNHNSYVQHKVQMYNHNGIVS